MKTFQTFSRTTRAKWPHTVAEPGFPLGGGADLVGWGANSRGGYVSKNLYVKTKESGPVGGARAGGAPWIRHWHSYSRQWCQLIYEGFKLTPMHGQKAHGQPFQQQTYIGVIKLWTCACTEEIWGSSHCVDYNSLGTPNGLNCFEHSGLKSAMTLKQNLYWIARVLNLKGWFKDSTIQGEGIW